MWSNFRYSCPFDSCPYQWKPLGSYFCKLKTPKNFVNRIFGWKEETRELVKENWSKFSCISEWSRSRNVGLLPTGQNKMFFNKNWFWYILLICLKECNFQIQDNGYRSSLILYFLFLKNYIFINIVIWKKWVNTYCVLS